ERRAALRDRLVEKPRGERRRGEHADGIAAGRFAEYRDVARVAAERGDVVADPSEAGDQIEQAVVAGSGAALLGELRMREKAERADAIGDADDHDAVLRDLRARVRRRGRRARGEAAAVDPDH